MNCDGSESVEIVQASVEPLSHSDNEAFFDTEVKEFGYFSL